MDDDGLYFVKIIRRPKEEEKTRQRKNKIKR